MLLHGCTEHPPFIDYFPASHIFLPEGNLVQLYLYIHTVLTARVFNDVNRLCRETFFCCPTCKLMTIWLSYGKYICLSNKGAKSTCMSSFIIFFSIEMIMLGYPPFSDKATLDHDIEISCKGPC